MTHIIQRIRKRAPNVSTSFLTLDHVFFSEVNSRLLQFGNYIHWQCCLQRCVFFFPKYLITKRILQNHPKLKPIFLKMKIVSKVNTLSSHPWSQNFLYFDPSLNPILFCPTLLP
ncbi:hypothetical protein FKM82_006167 [Ascaphus truei]